MSELTAHLDLPLGEQAPGAARRAVSAVLDGWGFRDPRWLGQTGVVVSELVTHAVLHDGSSVEIRVEAHEGRVTLSIADGLSVVPGRDDELSLILIEGLSAGWGVHDHNGGKRVWVELPPCPGSTQGESGSGR